MKVKDLKVGMKVRIKKDAKDIKSSLTYNEAMEQHLGTVVTITHIDRDGDIKVNDEPWYWDVNWLEFVEFNKELITDGCRVTLDNGEKLIYFKERDEFVDIKYGYYNSLTDFNDINEDGNVNNEDNKIIKIEYPRYVPIYEKDVEVKEMTLKEVCDALGYEVKIKKED